MLLEKNVLVGKGYHFVEAEKNEGVSKNSGMPYLICKLTISNGLESFKLDLDPEVYPICTTFKYGEKIDLKIDIVERFDKVGFVVISVASAAVNKAS